MPVCIDPTTRMRPAHLLVQKTVTNRPVKADNCRQEKNEHEADEAEAPDGQKDRQALGPIAKAAGRRPYSAESVALRLELAI